MANILPISDLRNYNEVLKNCRKGEPVYLTKNGRGRFVVMDIEDYEHDCAEKKLLLKLREAEEAVKDGKGWLDLDELKAIVGEYAVKNADQSDCFLIMQGYNKYLAGGPRMFARKIDWLVINKRLLLYGRDACC